MRTMYGIIASFWFLWWLYRLLSRQERYKLVHHIPTLWIVWSTLSHSAVGHFLCPKSICPVGKHMHNCIRIIWIYGARVLTPCNDIERHVTYISIFANATELTASLLSFQSDILIKNQHTLYSSAYMRLKHYHLPYYIYTLYM